MNSVGILKDNFKRISQNEMQAYRTDGFTKVGAKIFTDHDFHTLKTTVDDIIIKNCNKERSVALGSLQFLNPELLFWILSANVLDIAEDFLGPNIGFLNATVFYKKPRSLDVAHWHTDTGGFERFKLFEEPKLINLTLALTRTDRLNGCIKCLPGTQFQKMKHDKLVPANDLILNPASINEEDLDLSNIKYLELSPNEASVHDVHVVHGSDPNPSDDERTTLSIRFFSASTRCNLEAFKQHSNMLRPVLVRGTDAANSGLKLVSIK